jgi:hypothetical protein
MAKNQEKTTMDLAPVQDFDLSRMMEGSEDIKESLNGITIRLPLVKFISTAGIFELPDGAKCEQFSGLVIENHRTNSYWDVPFEDTGGGTPPMCFSSDAVRPSKFAQEIQHDNCIECRHNKFGSEILKGGGKGPGKACRNIVRIHFVTSDRQFLPFRLQLSPSSIVNWEKYVSALASMGQPYSGVFTKFFSKPASSSGGIKYHQVDFVSDGSIGADQIKLVKAISKEMYAIMHDEVTPEEAAAA